MRRNDATPAKPLVLDTSAVIALLENEPEAASVLALLDDARQGTVEVCLPFLALMEVEYILMRRLPPDRVVVALTALADWPVRVVESDPAWRHEAAHLKAAGGLSLADAWVAALALLRDAELVHKDPEFDAVPSLRAVRLPYDRDTS